MKSESKNIITNLPTTSTSTQTTTSPTQDTTTTSDNSKKQIVPKIVTNTIIDHTGISPILLSVNLANSSQPSPLSTTSTKYTEEIAQMQVDDKNNTISGEGREERTEIYVENPFAFNPSLLSRLIDPKNINLLRKIGGVEGILKGLHTDSDLGLSTDEKAPLPPITIDDISSKDDVDGDEFKQKDNIKDLAGKADTEPKKERQSKKEKKAALANAELTKDGAPFSQRKRVFGVNVLPTKKTKTIFELMWIAMQDKVLIILTVAAFVSLGLGLYEDFGPNTKDTNEPKIKWVEGVAIVIAIAIVVMVGSINDWQKEKQFQRLNAKKEDRNVKVTRNGKEVLISVHDVLVGDILHIEPGEIIAVDGVLISGHNLRCDESAATGESDAVKKLRYEECLRNFSVQESTSDATHHSKADPFLISGSKVLEGVGKYVVIAVGQNSFYGRTLMALRTDSGNTPLQEKLNGLAERIAKLGGAAALLMLIVLLIKYFVNFRNGIPKATQAIEDLVGIIISTVTIVVVAVPEGLPLAVTLALAYATTRMLKDNNLVRVLSACETMGNANIICSDKTGTLTQNKMTVVAGTIGISTAFVRDHEAHLVNTQKSSTENSVAVDKPISMADLTGTLSPALIDILNRSIAINSTAFEGVDEGGGKTFIGSKTDTALLSFLNDLDLTDYEELRRNAKIVQVFPFSSDRKSMGVVLKLSDSKYRFYVKGASEVLVRQAESIVVTDSTNDTELRAMKLSPENLNTIQHIIMKYASQTLRTIALGYRDFEEWPPKGTKTNKEGEVPFEELVAKIILLAIVGIEDPLRDGVHEAVRRCQKAGVSVVMVTGDNVLTAKSIATQCGIYKQGDIVMEGPQFRILPPQEMERIIQRLTVLARSSPEDKRILVAKLKDLGRIVAVTGDGTNDGPALKTADVGFSMGIAGTEVAKEASSIILMDDNFSSILKAIMWGRSVNDSVKKFLQFQLTVNVTAVLLTFISAVSSGNETSVLSAVQLLWVNLIMDTLAALALATDPPTEELLDREPEARNAPLISFDMWKMIIGQSIFQLVITLILLYAGSDILHYGHDQLKSLIFNVFVFLQIFNEVNCRRLDNKLNIFKNVFANKFFMTIFVIICIGQVLIIQFGGAAFQVNSLNGVQWAISLGLGFLSIPFGVIIRLIPNEVFLIFGSKQQHISTLQKPGTIYTNSSAGGTTQTGEPKPSWTDVQKELTFFKAIRGGRLRASSLRDKDDSHTLFAAVTIVPSLIAGSVGAGWTNHASNSPSDIQLDLSSTWFPSTSASEE
ncbi:11332_t:CDS:2 [Ambispora leptoticha]|uniref:Calcium-transporting ATPase n=1 Tax=Ambispora leptoticha TaxID=144679 RepID=A0A9N9AF01_9GLOM|nr:11332_t:CDS:2 [Ambispora leptoticha]